MSHVSEKNTVDLDVRGMICPLPVLRARKALASLQPGELLRVYCPAPAAAADFPAFCQAAGHSLVETTRVNTAAEADLPDAPDTPNTHTTVELTFLICRGT